MALHAVILAGGIGSRFWPLSRESSPKQLISVAGDESLLKSTLTRLTPLVPPDRVSVVTNPTQAELIRLHLIGTDGADSINYIVEPFGRNTAPAIGLAAVELVRADAEAVMAVLPADHMITEGGVFRDGLAGAAALAAEGRLVTFGIKPERPETGYGYIKASADEVKAVGVKAHNVDSFVEKPDVETAKRYIDEGGYLWNAGIFVRKAARILAEIKTHLPELYKALMEIKGGEIKGGGELESIYDKVESVSIDTGVMEKAAKKPGGVVVIEAAFPWSDMGCWQSLEEVFDRDRDGNIIKGRVVDIDSKDSTIFASDRVVATIGLNGMIVVDTPDATLICPKERTQEVRDIVALLKKKGYSEHDVHVTVERPWGAYTVLEKGDNYKIKKIRVEPGRRLSMQLHKKRSEHWVVISGRGRVTIDDAVIDAETNHSIDIPAGTKHRLENTSSEDVLEIIEVSNGEYIEEDDIVRFDDDFERS